MLRKILRCQWNFTYQASQINYFCADFIHNIFKIELVIYLVVFENTSTLKIKMIKILKVK